jgi:hypothetical protein
MRATGSVIAFVFGNYEAIKDLKFSETFCWPLSDDESLAKLHESFCEIFHDVDKMNLRVKGFVPSSIPGGVHKPNRAKQELDKKIIESRQVIKSALNTVRLRGKFIVYFHTDKIVY